MMTVLKPSMVAISHAASFGVINQKASSGCARFIMIVVTGFHPS
jgi:hypothetical protein